MSNKKKSCFATLPVELFHRIFDYLNTETLIFSIRYVSTRLYYIVSTYNSYDLDFRYMSKSDIPCLARIIHPDNVISLTLSDEIQTPGQVASFLTHFHIENFIRLRSLTLVNVDAKTLDKFQKLLINSHLTTLSITSNVYHKRDLEHLMSYVLSENGLDKFEYKGNYNFFNKIQSPVQSRLKHVIFHQCSWLTVFPLIQYLPYLETLNLNNISWNGFDSIPVGYDYIPKSHGVTTLSLSFSYGIPSIDSIQSALLLLPMLKYLRLISMGPMHDLQLLNGSQWENFIHASIPLLEKFEFWFACSLSYGVRDITVDSLIIPFRTSFWLDTKHWTVKCDYEHVNYFPIIHLYTIPTVREDFNYAEHQRTVQHSAMNFTDNNMLIPIHASRLSLTFRSLLSDNRSQIVYLFPNVTDLTVVINENWNFYSIEHLCAAINPSKLQRLWLDFKCECNFIANLYTEMNLLFKRTLNLHSLRISHNKSERMKTIILKTIGVNLPLYIKHLDTDITHVNDAKEILKNAEHLSSITFRINEPWLIAHEIDKWLWEEKRHVAYQVQSIPLKRNDEMDPINAIHLWLDKTMNKPFDRSLGQKRFKRIHHS